GIVTGTAALLLCIGLYGPAFVEQVIGSGRTFTLDVLLRVAAEWGLQIAPFAAAAGFGAWLARREPPGRFVAGYLVVSLVVGGLRMTGGGVSSSTFCGLVIAMMLGCALLLARMVASAAGARARAAGTALAVTLLAARFMMLAPNALAVY